MIDVTTRSGQCQLSRSAGCVLLIDASAARLQHGASTELSRNEAERAEFKEG